MASWLCCHDGRAAHHFAERAKSVEAADRTRIITFALSHRLPAIFNVRDYVVAGALMSYGPNLSFCRVDDHVDKIWRGAQPADISV
jgi:putative ABC transport system substrate-binding protein